MLRRAVPGDEAAMDAFLARHAETSMFLRANLAECGLVPTPHPHATTFWLWEPEGAIAAIFGRSNAGALMLQAPTAPAGILADFVTALAGREMSVITGEDAQVRAALAALDLPEAAFALDRREPLYVLELCDLDTGAITEGALRSPNEGDRALLLRWFAEYEAQTLGALPGAALEETAARRSEAAILGSATRLLEVGGVPVAMTGFNARIPGMVQIGGVYTPPEGRGRGHARTAVALHLIEARAAGATRAILFASGPAACRAYEAIGFREVGAYRLSVLRAPVTLGAAA